MRRMSDVLLGIIASVAGFVDVGQLVYTLEAGGRFGYRLMWPLVLGTIGIVLFCEMAGRIAAVTGKSVMDMVRERYPACFAPVIVAVSVVVATGVTAAELGGVAILVRMPTGWGATAATLASAGFLLLCLAAMSFNLLQTVFGLLSLLLVVFGVAALGQPLDWTGFAAGFLPGMPPSGEGGSGYAYFAVGLAGTVMMPCQMYFYASGVLEDGWSEKDLRLNVATVLIGFLFGAVVSLFLIALGAVLFRPQGIFPQVVATMLLPVVPSLGRTGLWIVWIGAFFSIAAAGLTSILAAAYNIAQYRKWAWGKDKPMRRAKGFTAAWLTVLAAATGLVLSGIPPLDLIDYAVMAAVATVPFAFWPVLRTASDRAVMGLHVNKPALTAIGWVVLVLSCIPAIAGLPLLVLTNGGAAP